MTEHLKLARTFQHLMTGTEGFMPQENVLFYARVRRLGDFLGFGHSVAINKHIHTRYTNSGDVTFCVSGEL